VDTLGDPRLKGKRIGIVAGTPPGNNMTANGLANAKPYPLVIDTRVDSSAAAMMHDLAAGDIDAGVLWGPMAGYYARQSTPAVTVVPLVKETVGPRLAYRMACATSIKSGSASSIAPFRTTRPPSIGCC
jgi:ABC-type amino acid transport substrate-binding protein